MHPEIVSAASHITKRLALPQPPSPATAARFQNELQGRLMSQYAQNWHPQDVDRGSASRALHWQPGPGGEGCSLTLTETCNEFSYFLDPKDEWTMWVDPGCVAYRRGPGPGRGGVSAAQSHSTAFPSSPAAPSIRSQDGLSILWSTPAGASLSSSPTPVRVRRFVPSLSICPSTPGFDDAATPRDVTPVAQWHGPSALKEASSFFKGSESRSSSAGSTMSGHSRRGSLESSEADSPASLGTTISSSSPATPLTWLDECEAGQKSPEHPSLHAPKKSLDASDVTEAQLHGLGLEDVKVDDELELAPEDAVDYREDEADERHGEGDDTLRPLDAADDVDDVQTSKPSQAPVAEKSKPMLSRSRSSSSVTSFDNGNVGVLGGGVKLGGCSSTGSNNGRSAGRSRANSTASNNSNQSNFRGARDGRSRGDSVSSRTGGWAAQQYWQQQQQYQQPHTTHFSQQQSPYFMQQALFPESSQHFTSQGPFQHHQMSQPAMYGPPAPHGGFSSHQGPFVGLPSQPMYPSAAPSHHSLPSRGAEPRRLRSKSSFPQLQGCAEQSGPPNLSVEGHAEESEGGEALTTGDVSPTTGRIRTRGKRTRGRRNNNGAANNNNSINNGVNGAAKPSPPCGALPGGQFAYGYQIMQPVMSGGPRW